MLNNDASSLDAQLTNITWSVMGEKCQRKWKGKKSGKLYTYLMYIFGYSFIRPIFFIILNHAMECWHFTPFCSEWNYIHFEIRSHCFYILWFLLQRVNSVCMGPIKCLKSYFSISICNWTYNQTLLVFLVKRANKVQWITDDDRMHEDLTDLSRSIPRKNASEEQ